MNRRKVVGLIIVGLLSINLFGCGKDKDLKSDDIKKDEEVKTATDTKSKVQKHDKVKDKVDDKKEIEVNKDEIDKEKEEKNEPSQEKEQSADVDKEAIKDSIIKGKEIIFNILTSRDESKVDLENNRTGVIEEYNSKEKIKSVLSPYYTDRYIEDFLNNILQAEEENGELTIALGDIGMWAEYSQLDINGVKDLGNNIYEVDYSAPSGVGDINHKATIEKTDSYWKMDKEINY